MNKALGCGFVVACIIVVLIVIGSIGSNDKEKATQTSATATTQPVVSNVPKLNIGLVYFLDKMNNGLKKIGAPKLKEDKDNPKASGDNCRPWCVSNYMHGEHVVYVVSHKDDRINEIMAVGAGDGTQDGIIQAIYGQWLLINVLSPGYGKEVVTERLIEMYHKVTTGEKDIKMILGGVVYSMTGMPNVGVMLTATKP